jgi:hypothetical protein
MPSNNYKSDGSVVPVTVTGAVEAGTPIVRNGIVGIAGNATGPSGGTVYLQTQGEFEINFISGCVVGDLVEIKASDNTLARKAYALGASASSGHRILGQVTAVPGANNTGTHGKYPASGKMWVRLWADNTGTA